ncbi:MAG: inorganic phosphate transporter [Amphritea sp.]
MDLSFLFFISSGLFLGWSLGANDAANIFGTAVGSRMLRFSTAALICSVFVVLGAVIDGAGAARALGSLGGINQIAGAFATALAAALSVFILVRMGLTASTTQAIVGAIVGWNLFTGAVTDTQTLMKILITWVACPLLAGVFAVLIFKSVEGGLHWLRPHLLSLDSFTRVALIVTGAFGAYTLGANNIANVMGVFMAVSPFEDLDFANFRFSSTQQLFLLGSLAIAVGVYTYSKRVMLTVGSKLMEVSPVSAWIIVVSHSLVLFLFASQGLEQQLIALGLPSIPLVPVSSTQAIIGAVVGIGLLKGGHAVNWRLVGRIGCGWLFTPVAAALICMLSLFVLQNLLHLSVAREQRYLISEASMERLEAQGFDTAPLQVLIDIEYSSARQLVTSAQRYLPLSNEHQQQLINSTYHGRFFLNAHKIGNLDRTWLSDEQWQALNALAGQSFAYRWQLQEALADHTKAWGLKPDIPANKYFNQDLQQKLSYLYRLFELEIPQKNRPGRY